MALKRLLQGLNCPFSDDFDVCEREHIITLVRWLEDRKIREYELDERVSLYNDSAAWDKNFNDYLERLNCPFSWPNDKLESIHWLVALALSFVCEDEIEADIPDQNTITNKINTICSLLDISQDIGDYNIALLEKIYQKVKFQWTSNAIESMERCVPRSEVETILTSFPLGFDSKGMVLLELAKMLYLSDFRDLQNEINALLVLVQEYTANPRLNSSLGKVGR